MKIALAHDSITQMGGAERVLQMLHEIYPEAPLFTLVYDKKLKENFEGWTIISSPLQYLYNLLPKFQWMLPFIPSAIRFLDFSGYDLVLSTSSAFIKNIRVPKNTVHICYCHTPARFLWSEQDSYVRQEVPAILRPLVKLYLKRMRAWDFKGAQRVTHFIANSNNVRDRIKQYYKRGSDVIYPAIDLDKFYPTVPKEDYYIVASRMQAHKRADLVIRAFNESGKKLHVIGSGRALAQLKAIASNNIVFLGRIPDHVLRDEMSAAKGFIFPQEEDFGLMPLEAMACGTAVIAYGKGGALETVTEPNTGIFFDEQSERALKEAVQKFETMHFQSEDLFEQAQKFSKEKFQEQIDSYIQKAGQR